MKSRIWRWLCVFAWLLVIYAFSHQPYSGRTTEKYFGGYNVPVRKFGHISEYLVLFVLLRWAVSPTRDKSESSDRQILAGDGDDTKSGARTIRISSVLQPSILAFLLTIGYAASDEWHQSFVPGRSSSWSDVAVDMCGASLGVVAWLSLSRMKSFRY